MLHSSSLIRHAELVSASIAPQVMWSREEKWTLKQRAARYAGGIARQRIQGDESEFVEGGGVMWFATKQKVEREIERLLQEFEIIDQRIRLYEDQNKIVGSIFGPAPELDEMRATHDSLYGTLLEALSGVRFGTIPFKEVAPQLKAVAASVRHFKAILDQTDVASAAGKVAFKARFGN